MNSSKCPHGQSWFCNKCSQFVATVYYHNQKSETTGKIKPMYHYSSMKADKKGLGVEKLMQMINQNQTKIQSYIIYKVGTNMVQEQGNF